MQKSKIEIEIEKFWKDITKQARKNAFLEEKEREKEERKNSTSKSIRLSKAKYHGVQENSTNAENSSNQTYSFQSSNFAENKPIKAIFKRISSSTTAAGAGRIGAYIGRISNEDEEQMLFYRGFCGSYDEKGNEQIEEIETKDPNSKAFLNSFFEEEILKISPTIGSGSEVESHHYIFSLPAYTRTLQNKILPQEELNEILKQATINTIKSNEILKARAVEMAVHQENHAHLNFCSTNFQGKKDLKFITKAQQMDILRDFTKECRNLGLNVRIPEKQRPLNLAEMNRITNIEYKENDQIKAITLQNEQGAKKRLMAVSINDFMQKNNLKINDKIAIEIQKNKFGRNFYKLLEKEENTEKEEPKIIKVSEQKEELNRLLQAEQQRQEKERAEEKKQHKDKTEQEDSLETTLNTLKEIVEKLNPNQQKEQTEQEEKIKELKKDKKVAIERLKKEVQPLKQEEDYYKHTTNQTYQGYKSIKIRIYENEIQSLNRDENAGLGDIKSSFDLTMDYRKENKNFLYELSLRRIQSFLNYRKDEIEKQEQNWEYEIEKTEEKRAKKKEEEKPLIKEEPKPQEKPQIKEQEIKKPQEPKKEYIKPKPKKKDRGFSR